MRQRGKVWVIVAALALVAGMATPATAAEAKGLVPVTDPAVLQTAAAEMGYPKRPDCFEVSAAKADPTWVLVRPGGKSCPFEMSSNLVLHLSGAKVLGSVSLYPEVMWSDSRVCESAWHAEGAPSASPAVIRNVLTAYDGCPPLLPRIPNLYDGSDTENYSTMTRDYCGSTWTGIRPSKIPDGCLFNRWSAKGLRWTGWSGASATGKGTEISVDSVGDGGAVKRSAVTLKFSAPKLAGNGVTYFSKLTQTSGGKAFTQDLRLP